MITSLKKEDLINGERELLMAMQQADLDKLDALIDESLHFNIPNGQTITKSQDLENYRSGHMKIDRIKSFNEYINVYGQTAVVTTNIQMEGKFLDAALDGKYKILRVWHQFDDGLRVIAGSNMKLEEK